MNKATDSKRKQESLQDVGGRLRRRQFSVRDLFNLTLIVSILLPFGVLSHGSQYFSALSTPWAAVSFLPIVAVWFVDRWQLVSARTLLVVSIIGYFVALGLPSLGWDDGTIFYGWTAWFQSFSGLDLFRERHIEGVWIFGKTVAITIPLSYPIACAVGVAANLAYLTAVGVYWLARTKPPTLALARHFATLAVLLAITSLRPMCLTGELRNLYPGYGLWTASFLALALSIGRTNGHRPR